jgi:hypothetical protein
MKPVQHLLTNHEVEVNALKEKLDYQVKTEQVIVQEEARKTELAKEQAEQAEKQEAHAVGTKTAVAETEKRMLTITEQKQQQLRFEKERLAIEKQLAEEKRRQAEYGKWIFSWQSFFAGMVVMLLFLVIKWVRANNGG